MTHPEVSAFFDPETWTVSYAITDEATKDTVIIDPVLNYDVLASQTSTHSADEIIGYVEEHGLRVRAILETHAHADHMTAARYLARKWGAPIGIGRDIKKVQETFAKVFGFEGEVATDGSQFDVLLDDGTEYEFGSLVVRAVATPGHTPACLSYVIGDAVFTGDALFMHDYGTGRADFPGGSAEALYASVHDALYKLPDSTRVFVGHDYEPGGRPAAWETTIGKQKAENVQLKEQTTQAEFIAIRNKRDSSLRPPRLIYQSIQVNVFGGRLPAEDKNGKRYLKTPLNMRSATDDVGKPKKPRNNQTQKPAFLPGDYGELQVEHLAHLPGDVRLIDVREPDEFHGELGHLDGAELVPLASLPDACVSWPKDAQLVMICRSGNRSSQAAQALSQMGFTHVHNLVGGMLEARKKGE